MSYVVIIDPGHGGEEYPGGQFGPYVEKDMALVVSNVIKNYLEQFDNVEVILTRNDDRVVELKDRADIAKAYNADLFISVHFNMSSNHSLFGSEIYIPAQKAYYQKMYPFALEVMNNFDSMGLYNRGIKTRLGSNNDNYYAVIKYATNYGIPSCIIEHCHLDNFNDNRFLPYQNKAAYNAALTNFGINDATAIAKFLKLRSTSLNIDYSGYSAPKVNVNTSLVRPDSTAPESNNISISKVDLSTDTVTVRMDAKDSNGFILYYQYSTDNGKSFSPLIGWPRTSWNSSLNTCEFNVKVPHSGPVNILTIAYNGSDLPVLSNVLSFDNISSIPVNSVSNKVLYSENISTSTVVKELSKDTFWGKDSLSSLLFGLVLFGVTAFAFIKKKIGFLHDKT